MIEIVRRLEYSQYPANIVSPTEKFSWSIGTPDHTVCEDGTIMERPSIKIPASTYYNGHGQIEDHRPLASASPYVVGLGLLRAIVTNMNRLAETGKNNATRQDENFQRILLGTSTATEIMTSELLRLPRGFVPTKVFLGRTNKTCIASGNVTGGPSTTIL